MKKVLLLSFLAISLFVSTRAWAEISVLERGTRSLAVVPTAMVARSPMEMKDIMSLFLPELKDEFQVDFDEKVVIFVFGGKVPTAGYQVIVDKACYKRGSLDISFKTVRPRGGFFAQMITSPWVVVEIPR